MLFTRISKLLHDSLPTPPVCAKPPTQLHAEEVEKTHNIQGMRPLNPGKTTQGRYTDFANLMKKIFNKFGWDFFYECAKNEIIFTIFRVH